MLFTSLLALGFAACVAADGTASVTPHDMYSSSIGVLGCKVDTNRIAYWPMAPGCDNLCVKLTYKVPSSNTSRSLHVMHVDQSGGAYDISYDAWNYLVFGKNATADAQEGGGFEMDYQNVPMSQCAHLITAPEGKLPLAAANSMNYVAFCLNEPNSWVAKNYGLWNIANSDCTWGINEQCTLDLAVSNQPSCPHQLGLMTALAGQPVYNVQYGTGKEVLATQ